MHGQPPCPSALASLKHFLLLPARHAILLHATDLSTANLFKLCHSSLDRTTSQDLCDGCSRQGSTGLPQFGAHAAISVSLGVSTCRLGVTFPRLLCPRCCCRSGWLECHPIQGCLNPSSTAPSCSAGSRVRAKGSAAAVSPGAGSWGTPGRGSQLPLENCLEHQATLWLFCIIKPCRHGNHPLYAMTAASETAFPKGQSWFGGSLSFLEQPAASYTTANSVTIHYISIIHLQLKK